MMMYLQVAAGFVLLLGGADIMVRGAVALARRMNISTLVIGMTVIAFGTSAPEMLVSLDAAMSGSSAMALGNIIGSNIANMLLIVGAAALIAPISIKPHALMRDGLTLMGASLIFGWFCWLDVIGFWKGALLFAMLVLFIFNAYWREARERSDASEILAHEVEEFQDLKGGPAILVAALVAGLGAVVFGADLLVAGGVSMARHFGVSDEVIGLTVLAIGTSLPELAASVVAAFRGHADVALGNVVGSNLFNTLGVTGIVAMVLPLEVPNQLMGFDLWVMLGVTLIMVPFLIGGKRLGRPVAGGFLLAYAAYILAQSYGLGQIIPAIG